MELARKPFQVLLADDDDDFCILVNKAFERANFKVALHIVRDGEELLSFLKQQGLHGTAPRPQLILLDLNMPRKDGRSVLKEIRQDDVIGSIPIVVLTTSRAERDVLASYQGGANSFISKPDSFSSLVDIIRVIKEYWFETVTLPPAPSE